MKTQAHDWKTGTDALALCSLCGAEYAVDAQECPDCHVSLSIVRRCPECSRLVSAQHTRCVYCRTAFTNELPKPDSTSVPPAGLGPQLDPARRRLRATAVSVGTFVIVFTLGILFLRLLNAPNGFLQTVARSHALAPARLRSSPSYSSSIAGMVTTNTPLDISGVQQNSLGRWMVLRWGGAEAYVPADQVAAPQITNPDGGVEVLEFFIEGMASPEAVNGARQSVNLFAREFPRSSEADHLRWLLAEHMRVLAQSGGEQHAALRQQADEEYQKLADGKGSYAERARAALQTGSTSSTAKPAGRKGRARHDSHEVQIIGDGGIQVLGDTAERHQVVVVSEAEVFVRPGKNSDAAAGSVLSGKTTQRIEQNGIVAVPAGASCTLKVLSAASDGRPAQLELLSIEIDHRSYPVHSAAAEWQSGDHALGFRLASPLVIQH